MELMTGFEPVTSSLPSSIICENLIKYLRRIHGICLHLSRIFCYSNYNEMEEGKMNEEQIVKRYEPMLDRLVTLNT